MIYLLFLIPILTTVISPKRFPLYATVFISMYAFYGYLWIDEHFVYNGKAAWKGFDMFIWTMFTGLFYFATHTLFIFFGWLKENKKMMRTHVIGLTLLAIHVVAVIS
ncbi:hypothetical protein ABS768_08830 [Flavobacterium sp. ST-75]|uniref:Uncharacterized protein n=1 Tax=Flavobacterium rhizophilum TaxID=3163296 RepID=A0ABW8YED2_9FLAO